MNLEALEQHQVSAEAAGLRLDRYLATTFPDHSRSYWQRMVRDGLVLVDGRPASVSLTLHGGEALTITQPTPTPTALTPLDLPLQVLYEDADIAIIDKPAGLVVHPAAGHTHDTLVNALVARFPQLAGGMTDRPGLVHRLDRDTSGLMVIALSEQAVASLTQQMEDRLAVKHYLALVRGHPKAPEATIEAPIGRSSSNRKKMAVVSRGRPAVTHYRVLWEVGIYSLVEARLETGRTHQIRVHLQAIGHPLAGDSTYGGVAGELDLQRQFLHACRLGFRHPASGEWIEFQSELPADLQQALARAEERR